jgi:predicted nucleic acid-binding protein
LRGSTEERASPVDRVRFETEITKAAGNLERRTGGARARPSESSTEHSRRIRGLELELVAEDLESRRLFAVYEQARIVPARYRNDLRHVAVATVARADALVSWNFKHLVNLKTRRTVHATNLRLGYPLIDIVSPEEV